MKRIPTLGPIVFESCPFWAIWIPRDGFVEHSSIAKARLDELEDLKCAANELRCLNAKCNVSQIPNLHQALPGPPKYVKESPKALQRSKEGH